MSREMPTFNAELALSIYFAEMSCGFARINTCRDCKFHITGFEVVYFQRIAWFMLKSHVEQYRTKPITVKSGTLVRLFQKFELYAPFTTSV